MAGSWITDGTGRLRTVWRLGIFTAALMAAWTILGVGVSFAGHYLQLNPVLWWNVSVYLLALVSLAVLWLCRRFLDRRSLASLGLGRPERRPTASPWAGVGIGTLAALVPIALLLFLGRLRFVGLNWTVALLPLLPTLAVAAFTEELIFRGYILRNIVATGHPMLGVVLSSALFALWHAGNPGYWSSPIGAISILVFGISFALACLLSGNLWFPTALHFAWNATQGAIFGMPISGFRVPALAPLWPAAEQDSLTGGDFGLEGSPLGLAAAGVTTLILLALLLHRRRPCGPDRTQA